MLRLVLAAFLTLISGRNGFTDTFQHPLIGLWECSDVGDTVADSIDMNLEFFVDGTFVWEFQFQDDALLINDENVSVTVDQVLIGTWRVTAADSLLFEVDSVDVLIGGEDPFALITDFIRAVIDMGISGEDLSRLIAYRDSLSSMAVQETASAFQDFHFSIEGDTMILRNQAESCRFQRLGSEDVIEEVPTAVTPRSWGTVKNGFP